MDERRPGTGYLHQRSALLRQWRIPNDRGFTVSAGTVDRDFQDVAYNFSCNEYLVTFDVLNEDTGLDIYGVRLSAIGAILTGGPSGVAGDFIISQDDAVEERPAVASCFQSDRYLVAWQSDRGTGGADYAIYARPVDGDAVPGTIQMVADTTSPQKEVDLACTSTGTKYLVAWHDQYVGGEWGIWARLASASEVYGPEFELMAPRDERDRMDPAVAGGPSTFLVAWEHDRDDGTSLDIYGRLWGNFVYLPLELR